MTRLWRDRGLGIVLAVLFLGSWITQAWTGWQVFVAEQATHGETAKWFGSGGYIWEFGVATMENWQSEFLQLFTFIVLTSFLIFRGSPESKEGQDEMMVRLDRIEAALRSNDARVAAGNGAAVIKVGKP
jgi:hypothetical protein